VTSTFLRRTSNIYHSQKRRAKAAGIQIDYTLDGLRDIIQAAMGEPCPYCGEVLKPSNISVDHRTPTSRTGPHTIANTVVCCEACNQRKGPLTEEEYTEMLALILEWPQPARQSVLTRLRAGGKFIHQN